jgi:hypothetical protein
MRETSYRAIVVGGFPPRRRRARHGCVRRVQQWHPHEGGTDYDPDTFPHEGGDTSVTDTGFPREGADTSGFDTRPFGGGDIDVVDAADADADGDGDAFSDAEVADGD